MDDDVAVEALSAWSVAPARLGKLGRAAPDAKLVARLRAGDERAFEAIYDRYHRQLLAFCRHMLGSREEAEDALQHVFVSAHRHLVARDEIVDLRPWLYAIARNRCLSVLRGRRESVALDDLPEPTMEGLSVAAAFEQRQDLEEVLGDLARLPDDQRAALVLSELGALSHDEIAGVLGVRRDKVKALVFQARETLAGWRAARGTDCREIREQLANLRGGALRRAPLRKHLQACDDCREFRAEVRRQREAIALVLPVVPSLALKAKVIGAVAGTGAVPAGLGAGVAGVTSSGLAGGTVASSGAALSGFGGGMVAKGLVVAAVAGTAGGGYVAVDSATDSPKLKPAPARVAPLSSTPAAAPAPGPFSTVVAPSHDRPGDATAPARGARSSPAKGPGKWDAAGAGDAAGKAKGKDKSKGKAKGQSDAATPGVPGRPPAAADRPGRGNGPGEKSGPGNGRDAKSGRGHGQGNGAKSGQADPPAASTKRPPPHAKGPPPHAKGPPETQGRPAPASDRPAKLKPKPQPRPKPKLPAQADPPSSTGVTDPAAPPRAKPDPPGQTKPKHQDGSASLGS